MGHRFALKSLSERVCIYPSEMVELWDHVQHSTSTGMRRVFALPHGVPIQMRRNGLGAVVCRNVVSRVEVGPKDALLEKNLPAMGA
jgi:hypothetical protein